MPVLGLAVWMTGAQPVSVNFIRKVGWLESGERGVQAYNGCLGAEAEPPPESGGKAPGQGVRWQKTPAIKSIDTN